jgi:ribosomal protein L11 methyltransferase
VGCGSGVLSIAAAKLGFAPVVAMDIDGIAVAVTLENARLNGVEIAARTANALTDRLPRVSAVVANIALDVVELLLPGLDTQWAVTSGYLDGEQPEVDRWWPRERRERDGWAADLFERA